MKYHKGTREVVLLLLSMAALALAVTGRYDWRWGQPLKQWEATTGNVGDVILTDRNGSRAADMWSVATSDVYARAIFQGSDHSILVLSVENGAAGDTVRPDPSAAGERPCLLISTGRAYVGALWYKQSSTAWFCSADWADSYYRDWDVQEAVSDGTYNAALALGAGYTLGQDAPYTYACYRAHPTGGSDGVWFRICYGSGLNWDVPVQISTDLADQIAVLNENPLTPVVAYHYKDGETHKIKVWKSWNCGYEGTWDQVVFDPPLEGVGQPSLALEDDNGGGSHAAMCWVKASTNGDPSNGGKIWVCLSDDFFSSHYDPVAVEGYSSADNMVYNAPTMSVVPHNPPYNSNVIIVSELSRPGNQDPHEHWLSTTSGLFGGGNVCWQQPEHLMPNNANVADQDANPCVDACIPYEQWPKAYCFYTAPGVAHRALYRLDADYAPSWLPLPPGQFDGIGRRIWLEADGTVSYAAGAGANVHAGPVLDDDYLQPILVSGGGLPALALDGDGNRWVSYTNMDTVWTMTGDGSYKVVFAGSSSAVPGQPSIVCYPQAATAGYVGSVVFPVYDTIGGTSKIMYARVDTSAVVLDTIESVENLRDSLPCVSLYKTDTLLTTFQHGDSILSVMLCDYGPGTTGRPGAWSSPNLVTAHGYHAMNAFEQGGSVLNCVWTGKDGDNYAIHRATNDLSGGMFPSWTAQADPSGSATSEMGNAVYAGLGVTCWQEKVSGKWVIKGNVRGEETTFIANDTDAYHPHAVAESSAIGPSIDQVRVHLLWTEGVKFEVDDGVYDTGETRYRCESLSVSHAGSDATRYNNGSKLLRKALSDSLFCTYADLDGAIMYAYSATGDTWQRDVMLTDRTWPAIAEDSSGKRWVVVHKANVGATQSQEVYYRNGSSWTGPQTLYTSPQNGTIGPAGLAGSSYTTSGIAYAAFLASIGGGLKAVILAKFNGSTLATYTVATGLYLGDPTLAVEPYKTDSDHVHLSWADNGVVKYCMDTDGRSSSIASKWTATITLSNAMVTASHPCIAADRDQIVVAWAQGATTEIYSRKRSTGSAYNNWQSELNLSNTNTASDYPTIAMGDTVIVAWEEHRTGSDYDVLACINFGDTVNIADNATKSGYPHVLFQNKTSGDTTIPYLLSIWSEMPETNVYEVAYNKLNLKHIGEGQQSAGKVTIPMKPALNACRPNPFRDRTQISYQLPSAGNVSLRVYDATGRTVRTLASGFQKPGAYSVSWDSKDSYGHLVPHGVYFYRLDTPGFRDVKKAVVTR